MEDSKRARSWKRRTQPRTNLTNAGACSLLYLDDPAMQKSRCPLLSPRTMCAQALPEPYPAIEGMCNVLRLLKTQNPRIGEVNIGLERMGRWTASLYDRTRNHHFANESKMGEEYVGFLR